MVAGTEVYHQSIPVLDVQYRFIGSNLHEIEDEIPDVSSSSSPDFRQISDTDSASDVSRSEVDPTTTDAILDASINSSIPHFLPSIRSGSYADIGPRRFMEDEHIRIDDLSAHLGSLFRFPTPSSFYGVFDGHGGPDAAAHIKKNAVRFFFEVADFPHVFDSDNVLLEEMENSVRKAFLTADLALADDCSVSSSSGTTALTALIFGRLLLVANAGDCRAVLCRRGEAVEMSQDHRPIYAAELHRIMDAGGFVDDGYLNGVLSVTRALGDWDLKLPRGSPSPLISDPEFRHTVLTEDDEFLIIGCDGIWDVMSSEHAVETVRCGLRQHGDPGRCARELVREALRRNTFDNLTVIVVCFSPDRDDSPRELPRLRCCSLSANALCRLKNLLDGGDDKGDDGGSGSDGC